jgi:hypothetical protein
VGLDEFLEFCGGPREALYLSAEPTFGHSACNIKVYFYTKKTFGPARFACLALFSGARAAHMAVPTATCQSPGVMVTCGASFGN